MLATASAAQEDNRMANAFHQVPRPSIRPTTIERLMQATAALQRSLAGKASRGACSGPPTMDTVPRPRAFAASERKFPSAHPQPLGGLLDQRGERLLYIPGSWSAHARGPQGADAVTDGARFISASFTNAVGTRAYKLYVPSTYCGQALPLIVMLHGCTQSPDDFAAGTRMNEIAERHDCFVAYPAQTNAANMQKCWNWFREADQRRDGGEPSLIAGITLQVMRDYAIDPSRVYVAGLSAGGAAAAVMADAYPELYAAIGVHSGLACGAARDMPSAFAVMRNGGGAPNGPAANARSASHQRVVPTIVFHGDADGTVDRRNGDAVVAQAARSAMLRKTTEDGRVADGPAYRRILLADADGRTMIEQWVIHGAGHAWSGGSPTGSYTDPRGPDASAEMLRFFLEHPHPTARQITRQIN
jgi:poly(hydroxyalkanoate) depolymerase family esterase